MRNEYLAVLSYRFEDGDAAPACEMLEYLAGRLLNGTPPPWFHLAISSVVLVPLAKPGRATMITYSRGQSGMSGEKHENTSKVHARLWSTARDVVML